jgi:hypothetical protein
MSDVQDKEWFVRSCSEAALYPRNLVYHDTYEHNLKAYVERLDEQESLLFCKESTSILDIWESDENSQSKNRVAHPSMVDPRQQELLISNYLQAFGELAYVAWAH